MPLKLSSLLKPESEDRTNEALESQTPGGTKRLKRSAVLAGGRVLLISEVQPLRASICFIFSNMLFFLTFVGEAKRGEMTEGHWRTVGQNIG